VWGDDERFVSTYFSTIRERPDLLHLRLGRSRDDDGYYFILGRTDDVINVAGHRLGTREIEEADVVAPEHRRGGRGRRGTTSLKGQAAMAFAVPSSDASRVADDAEAMAAMLEGEVMKPRSTGNSAPWPGRRASVL
jgi:propionyl-CoA synthetase